MYLSSEKKQELFSTYGKSNKDTGSVESQVALFSYRIAHLTEHLKANHKDFATQRALTKLVGNRHPLLRRRAWRISVSSRPVALRHDCGAAGATPVPSGAPAQRGGKGRRHRRGEGPRPSGSARDIQKTAAKGRGLRDHRPQERHPPAPSPRE